MCGIFGYYHCGVARDRQHILDLLFAGLKRLEYRGYDSAGLAVDFQPGEAPLVLRAAGKVKALQALASQHLATSAPSLPPLSHHAGIAHTRWATHGVPSIPNCHPQASSAAGEFLVVHNGIITNHAALKEFLVQRGDVFESDTDTEVIPKLCRYIHSQVGAPLSFQQLITEVMSRLEGAFALLIKSSAHYPGQLMACKRGSPMVVGVLEGDPSQPRPHSPAAATPPPPLDGCPQPLQLFFASDSSAILEHTRKVLVLEDDDMFHVADHAYGTYSARSYDLSGGAPDAQPPSVCRALETLTCSLESIMKGEYGTYMEKEIYEQPQSLTETMRGRVVPLPQPCPDLYAARRVILGGISSRLADIRRCRRVVLIGCGTSYHAGLAARATLEDMCDVPVTMEVASDFTDRACPVFRDDVCVFMSQSGETADTLIALEYAKARGALCVGVTNVVGSAISRATHCGVHLNAGYEIGVASTKAYTCCVLALVMVGLAVGADSVSKAPRLHAIADAMAALPGAVAAALKLDGTMRALAEKLQQHQSLLFFGRGYNYATVLEAALKVKEVALIHSEGLLAGEMKHGPLALVDGQLPLVVVATRDAMHDKMVSVVQQLKARSGYLILLCAEADREAMSALVGPPGVVIAVPGTVEQLQPIVNVVPLQLLAFHLAVLRGHNVDQPRNLAKAVTVTE